MQQLLTEAEAWRMIGEAFEAKAAHPELDDDVLLPRDIASDGMCQAIDEVWGLNTLPSWISAGMEEKVLAEVNSPENPGTLYLQPWSHEDGGSELRATLAYLFAEEAAA